jgi:hypothetical protein
MPEFVSRVPCPAPRSLFRRGRAAAALLTLTVALAGAGRAAAAGEPPTLKPAAGTRDFVFAEPTPAREVYRAIGDAFGLNVIFDPHLAKSTLSLEIPGADALTALDRVASAAGHFYKPLDARTIMVAADTPQNRRTYEDLVVRSFDLTDADPRTVVTLLVAGELASSVRLASGETFLVTELGPAGLADPGRPSSAQVPGAAGGADRALVVALTPQVVRAPEPIPEGLEALWVGTEANIRFSGGRQLGSR